MKRLIYAVGLLNLAAILLLWWQGSAETLLGGGPGPLIAFGRLAGLLGQLFILIQLVLVGRLTPIERIFGHDKLLQLHRRIGYGILSFFILHPLLLTIGYARLFEISLSAQFKGMITATDDLFRAFLALLLFIFIIAISLPPTRRRLRYENWYLMHLLMYLAIGLAFTHQLSGTDVSRSPALQYWLGLNFIVFGVFVCYRFLRPLILFWRYRFEVEKVVPESATVNSVYLKGRGLERYRFAGGQFANVMFLQKGFFFSHPFSYSIAYNGQFLRHSIKALGDFTERIPELKPGTKVIVDGPLGVFTQRAATRDKFLLIAGGIGITPLRSMAEELARTQRDVVLMYSARTLDDLALRSELEALPIKRYFILSGEERPEFHFGQIDLAKIAAAAPDWREREIYLCGPKPMLDALRAALRGAGVPADQIHFERFVY